MSFVTRKINLTFLLGTGQFGTSGSDKVECKDLRVSATITNVGFPAMSTISMDIFGLEQSVMDQLSTLGMLPGLIRQNSVIVAAGDGNSVATVFTGSIWEGFAVFDGIPEVSFHVEANTGLFNAVKSVPPTSFKGTADVATLMSGFAKLMGYGFENSGVNTTLENPYFSGSARDQARRCAQQAGINVFIDKKYPNTLAIWPKGGSRGGEIPLISAASGMIGYPGYTSTGISVRTIYNPSVQIGGKIEVLVEGLGPLQSKAANGQWIVYAQTDKLESEKPGGLWESQIESVRPGFIVR